MWFQIQFCSEGQQKDNPGAKENNDCMEYMTTQIEENRKL